MQISKKKSTTPSMKLMGQRILRTSAETPHSLYPCQRRSRSKQPQLALVPVFRRKRCNHYALSAGQLHQRWSTRSRWKTPQHPRIPCICRMALKASLKPKPPTPRSTKKSKLAKKEKHNFFKVAKVTKGHGSQTSTQRTRLKLSPKPVKKSVMKWILNVGLA